MSNGMTLLQWAQYWADQYSIPWPIFYNLINQESGWSPTAYNAKSGAAGIAQIIPSTAAGWNVNPWDPYAAIQSAAEHFSESYSQYGNSWTNALIAYNCGGRCVGTPFQNLPAETQNYVRSIFAAAQKMGSSLGYNPSALGEGGMGSSSSSQAATTDVQTHTTKGIFGSGILGQVEAGFATSGIALGAFILIAMGGLWILLGSVIPAATGIASKVSPQIKTVKKLIPNKSES